MNNCPEWFHELAKRRLSLAATRVGLVLFDAGSRSVDVAGNPVYRGQVSLSQLEKLTCLTRRSVLNGLEELQDLAGLVRHAAVVRNLPWGYTIPVVQNAPPRGSVKSTPRRLPAAAVVKLGSAKSTPLSEEEDLSSSSTEGLLREAQKVHLQNQEGTVKALAALGADDPLEFLRKFPLEQVQAWVRWAQAQPPGKFKNLPGFIFRKLQEGKEPLPVKAAPDLAKGADPAEFTRGQYGHIYRY